jgi:spoIIIJ-associated protein
MEWVETTGRSIEAALDAALDELGVDEQDVEFEVLQEPKAGLFGRLGATEARVRARVKPVSREKPGERQRRNRRGAPGRGRSAGEVAAKDASPNEAGAGTRPSDGSRSRSRRRGRGGSGSSQAENGSKQRQSRSARSGRSAQSDGRAPMTRSAESEETEGKIVETIERDVPIEEQARAALEFTRGLVEAFDVGGSVDTVVDDDAILVQVTGSGLGLLVGPKGVTLAAIEELVRTVVQRQTDGHGARIHVDVAGYRARRREALAEFTQSLAAKVVETGRSQRLEPMSAADRKIVHDTAAEIDGVTSESEGEDPRRRVVLHPA